MRSAPPTRPLLAPAALLLAATVGAAPGPGPAPAEASPASPLQQPSAGAREPAAATEGDTARRPAADTLARGSPLGDRPWQAWARDGLALAALFGLDRPVRAGARELEAGPPADGFLDEAADRAEWFGDWKGSLPWVVGGSLAVGGFTGGADGAREAVALLAGAAAGSFANEAVNRAVGRGRPSWEEGALSLHPFRGHASFPSGHTAYVFGVASGIDAVTDGWLPAAAAYGVAGATGLSRIYHDRHWLTDVVAGAALSTVVSRVAARRALEALSVAEGGDDGRASAGEAPRRGGRPAGRRGGRGRERGPVNAVPRRSPRLELLATPRSLGVTLRF